MADTEIDEIEATRKRIFDRYVEPMDEESIELLKADLLTTYGRFNRLCNMLLLQPKGLGSGCIDALHDLKCNISRIRYYLEQRDKPLIRKHADDIKYLAELHRNSSLEAGAAARRLLEAFPIGSET